MGTGDVETGVSTRWSTASTRWRLGPRDVGQREAQGNRSRHSRQRGREGGRGQEGHYWGGAEAQDAAILDL